MSTTKRSQIHRILRSSLPGRAPRRRLTALALVLGACAVAPLGAGRELAPPGAPERLLLRARSGDAARDRAILGEVMASFDLREVTAYESGCRLVERPRGASLDELRDRYGAELEVEPEHVYRVARTVNDPLFTADQQAVMAAIHAPEAWDFFPGQDPGGERPGTDRTVVAVLDTGVDASHPDLARAIEANPVSAIGSLGLTVDVLDLIGDTTDRNGHGTASAGIIVAQGDNGIGIAGVAWGSRVLPVKCFDDNGESDDDRLIRCYQYITALKRSGRINVRVANNGWGGLPSSPCLMQAIAAAGDAGILSVFAAGNHAPGRDLDVAPEYPAASGLPSTISVASAALDGSLAEQSNFGASTVDLAAPGVDVVSLGLCRPGAPCSTLVQVSGTSFAAPFVSGAAALLFAQDPTRGPQEVKRLLTANVTRYPALDGAVRSGGMLDIAAALGGSGPVDAPVPPGAPVDDAFPALLADGTYIVDVAEFPGPTQKSPPIMPAVGYLFVRTVEGTQEQRWLLQGWNGHTFLRPPIHAMGMTLRPDVLPFTAASGSPAVVTDLASWTAFARSRFVSADLSPLTRSIYAKVSTRAQAYDGPMDGSFDYPPYLDPPAPVVASVSQLDPTRWTTVSSWDQRLNAPSSLGTGFALSDGENQTREHWVLSPGAGRARGSLVVGSTGAGFGAQDFARAMNQQPWQEGSTLVLGSVRYYPYVAE